MQNANDALKLHRFKNHMRCDLFHQTTKKLHSLSKQQNDIKGLSCLPGQQEENSEAIACICSKRSLRMSFKKIMFKSEDIEMGYET